MNLQGFITDLLEFDTDPAVRTDVRWFEVGLGRVLDQCGLKAVGRRHPDGEMPVFMMIVDEHSKDAFILLYEEGRRPMRQLFAGARHHGANSSHSCQLSFPSFLA